MTRAVKFHSDLGASADPAMGSGASSGRRDRSVRVLMVDDRPENLVALRAVLEPLGEDLVAVTNGRDALRHLLHDTYAAILLDVEMPDLDGFETAALIREHPRLRETPILFLTAHGHLREFASRAYALGAVDFLVKPLEVGALTAKVRAFADLHRRRLGLIETNARLQRQSSRDLLTGLLHTGALENALRRERIRCTDSGQPLSASLIELVGFDGIRRAYGTAVSELITKEVGRILGSTISEPGILGRLEGDRFLILRPGADVHATCEEIDDALDAVRDGTAMPGGQVLHARATVVHASHPAAETLPSRGALERLIATLASGLPSGAESGRHARILDAPPLETTPTDHAAPAFTADRHPMYAVDGSLVAVELRRPRSEHGLLRETSDIDGLIAMEQRDLAVHVDLDPVLLLTATDALRAAAQTLEGRNVPLTFEVPAHALSAAPSRFAGALASLQQAGARILLDDLGARPTGMEAVVRLAPDAVKLAASALSPIDHPGVTRRARMLDAIGADVFVQGVDTPEAMAFVRRLAVMVPIAGIQGAYPSRLQ